MPFVFLILLMSHTSVPTSADPSRPPFWTCGSSYYVTKKGVQPAGVWVFFLQVTTPPDLLGLVVMEICSNVRRGDCPKLRRLATLQCRLLSPPTTTTCSHPPRIQVGHHMASGGGCCCGRRWELSCSPSCNLRRRWRLLSAAPRTR